MSIRRLVLAAGVIVATGCLKARDRLDIPHVSLDLTDATVEPGGRIRGVARATDESGIIFFLVTASTADSTSRDQRNRISADSVEIGFELKVSSTALADEPVEIRALARDNQEFEVMVFDTVFVRIPGAIR